MSGKERLESWLDHMMKICLSDGRVVVGRFVCTDSQCNIILSNCYEYLPETCSNDDDKPNAEDDSRFLGLAMVPGRHIVDIYIRESASANQVSSSPTPMT
ncbi:unnamed protein product [Soboliphyme baturini]|uniref:Sm domain-containing protein n=1 Tax=Soboliphyme baturini TaxID=241478 RepID=A0A183I9G7_9BILA|nr:unnamed protein product [Soboliphyme baturini]